MRKTVINRLCGAIAVGCVALYAAAAGAADESAARQMFKTRCIECHGPDAQEGGLRLDTLGADFAAPDTFAVWVKVHDRLQKGEMPPRDSPQPSADERRAVVAKLGAELTAADLARRKAGGRAGVRRLNRTEYEYTLRDLLDLPGLPVRDLMPEDGRAHGFDKSADGLELSHVQIAKYMELADLALDAATAMQIAPMKVDHERIYPTQRSGFQQQIAGGEAVLIKDFKPDESVLGFSGKKVAGKARKAVLKDIKKDLEAFQGSVGLFKKESLEFHPAFHDFHAPAEGNYRLKISCWSFTWDKGEILPTTTPHVIQLRAGPRGKERFLGYFDLESMKPKAADGADLETMGPKPIEITAWLHPGEVIGFNVPTLRGGGAGGLAKWTGEGYAVDWLEVDGPLYDRWPMLSHRRLFGDLPLREIDPSSTVRLPDHSLPRELGHLRGGAAKIKRLAPWTVFSSDPKTDAARLLGDFLPRAFRRPVTADEVALYVAIVEQMLTENMTFEDALRWAYKTALCSPEFLYLAEPPGRLNDLALASRLSYFLWSSMPDEELIDLAVKGKLHDPAVLRSQVDRMLADAKGERFVDDFVDQWLDLMDIDATTPDRKLYPEFNPFLRDSMLGETRSFFREMLKGDLSVLNIVDSDFAMLNQRMAEFYGIPGVQGTTFREVKLPPGCHRGGMITQAALMKVTANGTTTTPVKRGVWVMREILGQPPDPPPPNVPAVEPDVSGATTIREQLSKHRSDQVCASCHAKIDPAGFALESFDVIGGWRTQYRALTDAEPMKTPDGRTVRYAMGPAVDPAGELNDGRKFSGVEELKKLLLTNPDQIARNVIEQLLTYATGTEVGFADRPVVDDILARTKAKNYGLRSILHEVVQSRLFREK